jgi:hypothetical protein
MHRAFHRSVPSLLFMSAILFMTGCGQSLIEPIEAYMMNKTTPPKDEAMVQRWIQCLREGTFGEIERGLDPNLRSDDSQEKLTSMGRLPPTQEPTSAKVIGYRVLHDADSSSTITTTLEYEFPHEWLLATLGKAGPCGDDHGHRVLCCSDSRFPGESKQVHADRKRPVRYVVLFLTLAALAVSTYAFIACLRTKMGKGKWLWAILCFVGIGRLAVNWATGATGFTAICIGVPPVGAAMVRSIARGWSTHRFQLELCYSSSSGNWWLAGRRVRTKALLVCNRPPYVTVIDGLATCVQIVVAEQHL